MAATTVVNASHSFEKLEQTWYTICTHYFIFTIKLSPYFHLLNRTPNKKGFIKCTRVHIYNIRKVHNTVYFYIPSDTSENRNNRQMTFFLSLLLPKCWLYHINSVLKMYKLTRYTTFLHLCLSLVGSIHMPSMSLSYFPCPLVLFSSRFHRRDQSLSIFAEQSSPKTQLSP